MNWIYFHLLVNHFPIVLVWIAFASMVVAVLIGRRQAWLVTAIMLTLAGVSAYPTFATGERASHLVEKRMPSAREHIHDHEEAADITLWILLGSGLIGLIGWYRIGTDDAAAAVPGWVKFVLTVPTIASVA